MAEGQGPARRKRLLTPEEKYEIWVQVLTHQLTQAEAAVRWSVDPTTVMKLRRVAKEGALTALAAARPGRPRQPEEDAELAAVVEALLSRALREAEVRDPDVADQHLSAPRALRELGRIRAVTLDVEQTKVELTTRPSFLQARILAAVRVDTSGWDKAHITPRR